MSAAEQPAVPTPRLTISQIETIRGRAVKDPTFATSLAADPAAAVKATSGLTLHPDEVTFFQSLGGNFATAATKLHGTNSAHYMAEA